MLELLGLVELWRLVLLLAVFVALVLLVLVLFEPFAIVSKVWVSMASSVSSSKAMECRTCELARVGNDESIGASRHHTKPKHKHKPSKVQVKSKG